MEIFKLYLVISCFVSCQIVSALYSDCGSQDGSIISVDITGCSNEDDKCILHRNSNVTFRLTFKPTKEITSVTAQVFGVILDVPVPFKLPNSDGCQGSNLECPLSADKTYTYEATLPVLKKYPKLSVDVKWELKEDDANIVCVRIPAKLV